MSLRLIAPEKSCGRSGKYHLYVFSIEKVPSGLREIYGFIVLSWSASIHLLSKCTAIRLGVDILVLGRLSLEG